LAGSKHEKYVYMYTSHFRGIQGKTRHRAVMIGKVVEPGKMRPNTGFYDIYNSDGKFLLNFIACVIRSKMLWKSINYLNVNNMSFEKLINILSDIKAQSNEKECRLTKALTKTQREILNLFGDADEIISLRHKFNINK
jgi:hypothetical protein